MVVHFRVRHRHKYIFSPSLLPLVLAGEIFSYKNNERFTLVHEGKGCRPSLCLLDCLCGDTQLSPILLSSVSSLDGYNYPVVMLRKKQNSDLYLHQGLVAIV